MPNKIQTNHLGVNVLVEYVLAGTRHISYLDEVVGDVEILTEKELLEAYEAITEKQDKIKIAKDYLKKQPGYAISNVYEEGVIKSGDIVRYKPL